MGVEAWATKAKAEGKSTGVVRALEGRLATCSREERQMRYSCKPSLVSDAVAAFAARWESKLEGGLELTFAESAPIAPWEIMLAEEGHV